MNRKKEKFRSDAFGYTQIHRAAYTQKCDNSVCTLLRSFLAFSHTPFIFTFRRFVSSIWLKVYAHI